MKTLSSLVILSGALALTTASVALVACSSSTTSTPVKTTPDSGAVTDTGPTTTPDAGPSTSCEPVLHVPVADGGIYCPFSYNDATDAGIQYCKTGTEQCCLSPANDAGLNSSCQPFVAGAGTCPASSGTGNLATFKTWQCGSPADCVGAPVTGATATDSVVCCVTGGALTTAIEDGGCSYTKTNGFDFTMCKLASACTGVASIPNPKSTDGGVYNDPNTVVCEQDSDCTAPGVGKTTCTPIKATGTAIGICQ